MERVLVGSIINYEIILKARDAKPKTKETNKEKEKERNIALKAFSKSEKGKQKSSGEEESCPSELARKHFAYSRNN